ncbi:uncharacterized protein TNCV_4891211 [Trichonephila clavipes]|nr:uncharacterized protein TNCV_4891211 [Trichonephila clavipes]
MQDIFEGAEYRILEVDAGKYFQDRGYIRKGGNTEHNFAASKATDHDVVGDEIENNSANPQSLVVENQHINLPEEPEHMANADYDALKKPVSVSFYFKPLPKTTQCQKKKHVSRSLHNGSSVALGLELTTRQKQRRPQIHGHNYSVTAAMPGTSYGMDRLDMGLGARSKWWTRLVLYSAFIKS